MVGDEFRMEGLPTPSAEELKKEEISRRVSRMRSALSIMSSML